MIEMPTSAATNVLIMPMLGQFHGDAQARAVRPEQLVQHLPREPGLGGKSRRGGDLLQRHMAALRHRFFALTMNRSRSRLIVCIFRLGDFTGSVTIPKSSDPSSSRCRICAEVAVDADLPIRGSAAEIPPEYPAIRYKQVGSRWRQKRPALARHCHGPPPPALDFVAASRNSPARGKLEEHSPAVRQFHRFAERPAVGVIAPAPIGESARSQTDCRAKHLLSAP